MSDETEAAHRAFLEEMSPQHSIEAGVLAIARRAGVEIGQEPTDRALREELAGVLRRVVERQGDLPTVLCWALRRALGIQ